jgi:hypothetical protein
LLIANPKNAASTTKIRLSACVKARQGTFHIADTLSRAPSPRLFTDDVTQDSEDQVHYVLHSVIRSGSTRKRYAEATSLEPTIKIATNGHPKSLAWKA